MKTAVFACLFLFLYVNDKPVQGSVTVYSEIVSVSDPILLNIENLTKTFFDNGINVTILSLSVYDLKGDKAPPPPSTTPPTDSSLSIFDLAWLVGIPLLVLILLIALYRTFPISPRTGNPRLVLPYSITHPGAHPDPSFDQNRYKGQ